MRLHAILDFISVIQEGEQEEEEGEEEGEEEWVEEEISYVLFVFSFSSS